MIDRLQLEIDEKLQNESIEILVSRLIQACHEMDERPGFLNEHQYWTDIIATLLTCRADIISIDKRYK